MKKMKILEKHEYFIQYRGNIIEYENSNNYKNKMSVLGLKNMCSFDRSYMDSKCLGIFAISGRKILENEGSLMKYNDFRNISLDIVL